jgi:hypothetical protein
MTAPPHRLRYSLSVSWQPSLPATMIAVFHRAPSHLARGTTMPTTRGCATARRDYVQRSSRPWARDRCGIATSIGIVVNIPREGRAKSGSSPTACSRAHAPRHRHARCGRRAGAKVRLLRRDRAVSGHAGDLGHLGAGMDNRRQRRASDSGRLVRTRDNRRSVAAFSVGRVATTAPSGARRLTAVFPDGARAAGSPLLLHGCRSGARANRALPDARSSFFPGVSKEALTRYQPGGGGSVAQQDGSCPSRSEICTYSERSPDAPSRGRPSAPRAPGR